MRSQLFGDRVLPFFAERGMGVLRILTDRGTEYCGKAETHDYPLYLVLNDIERTKTRVRKPQTNGICERFHKTILRAFYQVAFRRKLYLTLDELQADLDVWLAHYNGERTHQGKMCCGRTPQQTLIAGNINNLRECIHMKTKPNTNSQDSKKPVKALTKVLGQTKEVKGLVDEAAQELSSVNAVLKQELEVGKPPPGVKKAHEKNETVEDTVQDAADKLSVVNADLKDAVHERHALEVQLGAVTEREEASRYASVHDALTGLPDRALFNDRLEHGLAQAKRHNWSLAVMFIDLDGFKKINDSYGHDAGDSVLKTIAARLTENTRDDDTVSRHGGDEFLYLLTVVKNEQDLTSVAEKLIKSIQTPCDVSIGDLTISPNISASIGISIFPKDGTTTEALIKSADQAMYRAKGSKSRYLFAQ